MEEEGYLPEGLEVSHTVGAGGPDEEIALFPFLIGVEVRVEGLGYHSVEVPEFDGFLFAEAGRVQEVFGLFELCFFLLYAGMVFLLGCLYLGLDAGVVYGAVVVDVSLREIDLKLGELDLDGKLELLKEEDAYGGLVKGVEHGALFKLHVLRLGKELGGLLTQFFQLGLEGHHLRVQGDGLSC